MTSEAKEPIRLFISYAHEDSKLRGRLDKHLATLQNLGLITAWDDGKIVAGQEWEHEILGNLETADVILLLISADFLASKYIHTKELKRAMERHDAGEARVIPVLLKPVDYRGAPFDKLEALPVDAQKRLKAVTEWSKREQAFTNAAKGIRQAIEQLQVERLLASSIEPIGCPTAPLLPRIWNVPHQRNPNFTGRGELLAQLEESLRSGQATALTQQAIHGLGGVGKTQLAVEYAYRHTADYDLVWWIRSEQTATLAADYAALAQRLNLPEKDATEQAVVVDAVRRWLNHNARWLLIFDNATDPKDLDRYYPSGGDGHLLITSRNPLWRGKAQPLKVKKLERKKSVEFLMKRTDKTDEGAARKLAEALGDLPLALEHAGAYVDATGISLAEYLKLFESYQTALFDEEGSEPIEYPVSITKTWDLAFQQVQQSSPAAVDLLNLCAFFAPDDIPLDMIGEGAEFLPEGLKEVVQKPLELNKAIAALRCYSLTDRDGEMISVHRMVQAVTRDRLSGEEQKRWTESAVRMVNRKFPLESDDVRTWPECGRLLPHALVAVKYAATSKLALDATGRLLNQMGLYFRYRAQFAEAKVAHERALQIAEAIYGFDHPIVALRVNNLGLVLQDLGDLTGAQAAHERALLINEAAYGPEHPTIANWLNNLGLVLQELGDLTGAQAAYERALRIGEATYGTNHPDAATSLNNLASVLQAIGDLEGAKIIYEQALRIGEATYGLEHPTVAIRVHNLGSVLCTLGDLEGAKIAYERALKIFCQFLGEEHPYTTTARNNLELLDHQMCEANRGEQDQ